MRIARLGALAEQDLIDIWQYTVERWDIEQADAYLDAIGRGIQQLVDRPETGAKREGVRDGYRVLFVNHHAIYNLVTPSVVQIVRVLHRRTPNYVHQARTSTSSWPALSHPGASAYQRTPGLVHLGPCLTVTPQRPIRD